MNSKADQYNTDCSTEKCKESFEKLQEDRKKAKVLYEQQLTEVTAYIGIYKENMSFVFAKCQRMEKKRIKFMVEMFSGIHRIMVDLVSPQKLIQLHAKMKEHFVELGDNSVEFDLRQWSIQHGIECSTKWPEFEEYSCEFRHIHNSNSRSRKQCRKLNSSGVVLTKKVTKDDDERSSNELRKIQNGKVQQFKTSRCSSEPRGDKTIAKEPEQFSGRNPS
ncbi:hypothetical protein Mgra_00004543 [Meloidogyne graminicola]|uniref:Uncharacterized protein n=1 Tax=Meloidogyne graminicola TaxID=189291 RepID=A0A8S9ZR72_9BILA|nr:hypothetical protein Mgra_00004543 [Meloidogyne graminicola]